MNTLKSVCLSWLVVTGALAGASGQSSPTNINPALLYYQAFLVAPDLSPADNDYLWTMAGSRQTQSPAFGSMPSPLLFKPSTPPSFVSFQPTE